VGAPAECGCWPLTSRKQQIDIVHPPLFALVLPQPGTEHSDLAGNILVPRAPLYGGRDTLGVPETLED
jgi:hypothetical protein